MCDINDHLDNISDMLMDSDTLHGTIMDTIAKYCNEHDLDPDGFMYNVGVAINDEVEK